MSASVAAAAARRIQPSTWAPHARHRAPRARASCAGRARPDELGTEEALDLVDQMAALGFMEVTLIGGEAYLRDDHVAPRDLRGGSPSFSVSLRSGETLRGVAQRASLPTVYNVQIRGCAGEISPRPVFGGFGFMVHPDKHGAPECAFFARSVWSFGLYER